MSDCTLLLKIAAPLQSWGSSSRFPDRRTDKAPSKSGIIGMIAAGLGRKREESIEDLLSLKFAVRIDQPGNIESDAHNATQWTRDTGRKNNVLPRSVRYYISDAVFVVGLEGDKEKLEEISHALTHPVYHLYLGRKSCPPSSPLVLGIREKDIMSALREEDWQASDWYRETKNSTVSLVVLRDGSVGESGDMLQDSPISFSRTKRAYANRIVVIEKPVIIENSFSKARNHAPFDCLMDL